MSTDPKRKAAISRLKARRDFATNLLGYIVVNLLLVGLWALGGGGFFWPGFVILGWGIGLAMHAWTVFGQRPITEADIEREMKKGPDDTVG